MKIINCVIFNSNKDILLLKENDEYYLPNVTTEYTGSKLDLIQYLKKDFGLRKIKDSYLIFKFNYLDNIYYYCEEPYNDNEFKIKSDLKDKVVWINEKVLKDVLLPIKSENSEQLINALSIILNSNFSFSQDERNELMNKIKKEKNPITKRYLVNKFFGLLLQDQDKLDRNEQEYKTNLIKALYLDLSLISDKKQNQQLEALKSLPLEELTQNEAILINKHEEWEALFINSYNLISHSPATNIDFIEEEIILQGKTAATPSVFISLRNRYADKTYKEMKEDISARKKEYEKKENS